MGLFGLIWGLEGRAFGVCVTLRVEKSGTDLGS
jgi:hypothetical protein